MHIPSRFRALAVRLRAAVGAPVGLAVLGGVAGALLAAGALTADYAERWQLTGVSTSSARALFGALLGGAITATAVLFWIRGMLVQLSASELSPRVVRGYLNDSFLHLAFAFLIAVFTHSLVTLLWLPRSDAEPVPALSSLTGAVLAFLAVVLIVHAVHNSVRAMSPSRVLSAVTARTLDVIRELHLPRGQGARPAAEPAADGAHAVGNVTASRAGWLIDIDYPTLARGLPKEGMARLSVTVGDFVTEGSTLAAVFARGEDEDWDDTVVESAFFFDLERHLANDVESGLNNLVGLAVHSLTSGTADRATAFEALRCINVLLDELLRREPTPSVLPFDSSRVIVCRFGRTNEDIVRATVGELGHVAHASPEFTRAFLEDLRRLAENLELDGFGESAELIRRQVAPLTAATRGEGFAKPTGSYVDVRSPR